ncbi:MAG: thiamine phosphate synthase [Candidatus Omnitrophota bacterium]|nr:thiamine phosphate synthase [Candidatus Omnitrophota bacterium]
MKGFYFITDARLSRAGNISDVRNALAAGVEVVQYRNKEACSLDLYAEARELRRLCRNVIFLINDRLDLALAVGADGVHLGQDDLPYWPARKILGKKKIIGLTVHTLAGAQRAKRIGADYVGVSPIFKTRTKADAGRPAGIKLIAQIKKKVKIPVIAIGGINLANAEAVIRAGADGLCAISAVVRRINVKVEIEKFQRLFYTC